MTEIGNRLGQTQVYLGVAKCWLLQKEFKKVAGTASAREGTRAMSLTRVLPPSPPPPPPQRPRFVCFSGP